MKNRFVETEPNNNTFEFAFFDKKDGVYHQLTKQEFYCLKEIIIQHDIDAEKVGEDILDAGLQALVDERVVYELVRPDGKKKRFIEGIGG